jgi:hypothetical protein
MGGLLDESGDEHHEQDDQEHGDEHIEAHDLHRATGWGVQPGCRSGQTASNPGEGAQEGEFHHRACREREEVWRHPHRADLYLRVGVDVEDGPGRLHADDHSVVARLPRGDPGRNEGGSDGAPVVRHCCWSSSTAE